jgi:hypothetical protein
MSSLSTDELLEVTRLSYVQQSPQQTLLRGAHNLFVKFISNAEEMCSRDQAPGWSAAWEADSLHWDAT